MCYELFGGMALNNHAFFTEACLPSSPSITDDDGFLFNVETQHEEEESMC